MNKLTKKKRREVVHYVIVRHSGVADTAKCGLHEFLCKNHTYRLQDVTCKNCIRAMKARK